MSDKNSAKEICEMMTVPASDGGQSPLDRILASMQDDHRRYLLYYLQEEDPCDLNEAARRIAAWDRGCKPADVPSELHDRLKAELHHIHLPKLGNLHIIEYDDRSGVIRSHSPPDKLEDFLELAREEELN